MDDVGWWKENEAPARNLEGETLSRGHFLAKSKTKKIEILFLILFLILGLRKSDFSAVGLRRRQLWGDFGEEGAVIGWGWWLL